MDLGPKRWIHTGKKEPNPSPLSALLFHLTFSLTDTLYREKLHCSYSSFARERNPVRFLFLFLFFSYYSKTQKNRDDDEVLTIPIPIPPCLSKSFRRRTGRPTFSFSFFFFFSLRRRMAETGGYGRFPGSLDPRAQEFRPRYSTTLFMPQPHHVFFPYSSPYPPISDVPLLPFCEGGVGYAPFPAPAPAYVPVRSPGQAVSSVATRSLVVSSVPCDVSETMVRRELEAFGDVRGVQMERVHEGIVIVHFYDIRHSERALREIRDQHMQHQCRLRNYFNNNSNNNRFLFSNSGAQFHDFPLPRPSPAPGLIAGHAVWAQFVVPASNAVPAGKNQGTIVVFNLDSTVSTSCLREIFEAFGIIYIYLQFLLMGFRFRFRLILFLLMAAAWICGDWNVGFELYIYFYI